MIRDKGRVKRQGCRLRLDVVAAIVLAIVGRCIVLGVAVFRKGAISIIVLDEQIIVSDLVNRVHTRGGIGFRPLRPSRRPVVVEVEVSEQALSRTSPRAAAARLRSAPSAIPTPASAVVAPSKRRLARLDPPLNPALAPSLAEEVADGLAVQLELCFERVEVRDGVQVELGLHPLDVCQALCPGLACWWRRQARLCSG